MGSIKLFYSIFVVASHELFLKQFFSQSYFPLLLGMFLLSLSFVETGFLVAKLIAANKYKNIKSFYFSRFNRAFLPCLIILLLSFIFLEKPPGLRFENVLISDILNNFNLLDKTIYYVGNILLQQDFLSFFSVINNELVFDPFKNKGGLDALQILYVPHFWSIGGDVVFMILFPLFYFNKKIKYFIFFISIFGLIQWYLNFTIGFVYADPNKNQADFTLFWQHYPNIIFSIGIGYFFGTTKIKFNPFSFLSIKHQAILAFILSLLVIFFLWIAFHYQLNYFIVYLFLLFILVLGCDLAWKFFYNKKYDLRARDIANYLYVCQFLLFDLVYKFLQPSIISAITILFLGFWSAYFLSDILERYNAKFISYLNKKYNNKLY